MAEQKACDKKGLKFYLEAEDRMSFLDFMNLADRNEADVIVLTETKVQAEPDIVYIKVSARLLCSLGLV